MSKKVNVAELLEAFQNELRTNDGIKEKGDDIYYRLGSITKEDLNKRCNI